MGPSEHKYERKLRELETAMDEVRFWKSLANRHAIEVARTADAYFERLQNIEDLTYQRDEALWLLENRLGALTIHQTDEWCIRYDRLQESLR